MFDQKEVFRRICHEWIRQGKLTKKEWTLLQARSVHNGQPLDELLLASTHITEQELLEALSAELGCRLWQGNALLQHVMSHPATNPLPDTMLLEHKMALLNWSPEEGTLHLVMPRFPSSSLLQELKEQTSLHKLQFELGTTESIDAVLSYLFAQDSTLYGDLATNSTTHKLHDNAQTLLKTNGSSPFDADTIRIKPSNETKNPFEKQTFATMSLVNPQDTFSTNSKQVEHTYTGDGATDYQPAPAPYPSSARLPNKPQEQIDTFENEPNPATQHEPKSFANRQASPINATEAWKATTGQIETSTKSEEQTKHKEAIALLDVADDEFFLDYTNDKQPSEELQEDEPLNEDWTPPPLSQKEQLVQPEEDWSVVLPIKKKEPVHSQEILELVEEVDSFEQEPSPLSSEPQASAVQKPSILGGSILPSDEELFTKKASSAQEKQGSYRLPSRPQTQNRPLHRPPSSVKIGGEQNKSRSSQRPKPAPRKLKKQAEKFALTVVLGGLMTIVNIILRLGIMGLVGYLIWFLFFSK